MPHPLSLGVGLNEGDLLWRAARKGQVIDRDLIDLTIANDGTIEKLEAALVAALGLEQA